MSDTAIQSAYRATWRGMLIVFLLALFVRVVSQQETRGVPTVRHLVVDAEGYHSWAKRIAEGDWMGSEGFYQAPLYPYTLAVWMCLAGDDIPRIRLFQGVLGAGACLLLCIGATLLWGRATGCCAGVLFAVYGPAVYYDGIIQKATLTGFLTSALFAAIAWHSVARRRVSALTVGGAAALLSITRENAMIWVAMLGAWLLLEAVRDRAKWSRLAAYALGLAMVLGPVAIRNWKVSSEWSLSTFQAGPNFYIGNHRGADGRYQPLIRGHETPQFERADAVHIAEQSMGRSLSAREVSSFWMRRGLEEIRLDPVGWVQLLGYKLLLTLNRYEVADGESLYVHRQSSWILNSLTMVWHFGILLPLAAIGLIAARGERATTVIFLMILSMVAAVAAFYVLGRYRFPIAVLSIPFAARGLTAMVGAIRTRSLSGHRLRLLVAIVLGVLTNVSIQDEGRLNAVARMNAGVSSILLGDFQGATDLFQSAVDGNPGFAEAHYNLGLALAVRNRFAEAVEHFATALHLEPALVGVEYNFAVALENVGRTAEALEHYRRAVAEKPDDPQARAAIERLEQALRPKGNAP